MKELICERCNKDYPIWYVDNNLLNKVIRDEETGDVFSFLCPTCFTVKGAMQGFVPVWRLTTEKWRLKREDNQ